MARWLAARLQRELAPAGVRLELWDRSSPYSSRRPPIGSLIVRDWRTLIDLLIDPELRFGEAYMQGRLDTRGPLGVLVEALSRLTPPSESWRDQVRTALAGRSSTAMARRDVHQHYDVGNEFYSRWLDHEMVYTCAYFSTPDVPLDAAQRAKLDLVCCKLRLRPGETVVEAGCGWGALALHMAREYGARVRAFNVSREQLAYARERARREGLASRIEFVDDDYRNVRGQYDAFVSIGMLEHVGLRQFRTLAEVIRRTVRRSGGRGLLHFIGRDTPHPVNAWIRRRIFPGSYTPTLAEVTTHVLAPAGMSVLDVENLRLHYAQTLWHWARRFAAVRSEVAVEYGEPFARAWELYLAGSRAAFVTGWMQLFQVVFSPCETPPPYWVRAERGAPTQKRNLRDAVSI